MEGLNQCSLGLRVPPAFIAFGIEFLLLSLSSPKLTPGKDTIQGGCNVKDKNILFFQSSRITTKVQREF